MKGTDKANATSVKIELRKNASLAIGAMIYMQDHLQILEEQDLKFTCYDNGFGFNKLDAQILGNFVDQFKTNHHLTKKQITTAKKLIPKYHRQIKPLIIHPEGKRKAFISFFQQYPVKEKVVEPTKPEEMRAELKNEVVEIHFPYDETLVAKVKTLSGRRFNSDDPKNKHWICPPTSPNILRLIEFGFHVDEELQNITKDEKNEDEIKKIDGILRKPYDYQLEGINFIEQKNGRALIADEMGLGKTIQALGWLQLKPEIRPAIIIVPASLKLNWEREIQQTLSTNNKVFIAKGKTPSNIKNAKNADIIIINYDIINGWSDFIMKEFCPKVIIMDECHYIANNKALRTKAVKLICKKAKHVLALSGTPIKNRPIELFNVINIINKNIFPKRFQFGIRYCDGKNDGWGWNFNGSSNTKELHEILNSTIMIRRKKEDVLKDLPPKIKSVIPIEITDKSYYDKAMKEFQTWIKGTYQTKSTGENGKITYTNHPNSENPAAVMVQMGKIKKAAAEGKMKAAIEWIHDFLNNDEKLVIFTYHTDILNRLEKEFKGVCVKIDGSVSSEKRQKVVDDFQNNDKIRLFIGNIKAAGVGITLTSASNTCFVELGWTPSEHDQAEDRVHRIGQKSDSVNAWYLIAKNTIEEDIMELLDKKAQIISAVIDNKEVKDASLLTELMKRIAA